MFSTDYAVILDTGAKQGEGARGRGQGRWRKGQGSRDRGEGIGGKVRSHSPKDWLSA